MSFTGTIFRYAAIFFIATFSIFQASAQTSSDEYERLYDFLSGYLKNDQELLKRSLIAQSKQLSQKVASIENGTALELTSGNVKITSRNGDTKIELEPKAELSLPFLKDAKLNADIPIEIEDGEKRVSDGELSAGIALISGACASRHAKLLKAERARKEAERAVKDRAIAAEKEFYTKLKKLYDYAISAIDEKNDLYEDTFDLAEIAAKGYGKDSAKYSSAYMEVQADLLDTVQKMRRLERETAIFARRCGFSYKITDLSDTSTIPELEGALKSVLDFLPDAIPSVKALDARSFPKDAYAQKESALYSQKLGALERQADSSVTFRAVGLYTLNDSACESDTAGGGLSLAVRGLSAYAGVALPTSTKLFPDTEPVSTDKSPVYTFSLALSPNDFRTEHLERKQHEINAELENNAISSADDSYENDVLEKELNLKDIEWAHRSYSRNYELYSALERDMMSWRGAVKVSEFDYIEARDKCDIAALNLLVNAAEYIIYNNETKLLFHAD